MYCNWLSRQSLAIQNTALPGTHHTTHTEQFLVELLIIMASKSGLFGRLEIMAICIPKSTFLIAILLKLTLDNIYNFYLINLVYLRHPKGHQRGHHISGIKHNLATSVTVTPDQGDRRV